MTEAAQVYVGSTKNDKPAEIVLEYTIRKNSSIPVDIHWMRTGQGDWVVGTDAEDGKWNIGRPPNKPHSGAWATDFTCFRFVVPEVAGFKGRAIYLDSDIMVLGDIAELWRWDLPRAPWLMVNPQRSDVSVIDCAALEQDWWPRVAKMKTGKYNRRGYHEILLKHGMIDASLSGHWNCFDGAGYQDGKTRLVHFTNMMTQPWKPYAGWFPYHHKHRNPKMVQLWKALLKEATVLPRSDWPGSGTSSLASLSPSSATTKPS